MRISTIALGLTAVGAIGAGVALAMAGDADAADETGVTWQPDAKLPSVHPGGAGQAEWAAAALGNLDANASGTLEAVDGAARGAWGSNASIVSSLIARYDASGDGRLDTGEAASIGADVATDGWLTADAVRELRTDLGA